MIRINFYELHKCKYVHTYKPIKKYRMLIFQNMKNYNNL